MHKPLFLATLLSGMLAMTSLHAAELKVIAGGSMTSAMNAIAPEFEKAAGHKLVIHFDSTPNIITRINSGTPFDVVIVPVDVPAADRLGTDRVPVRRVSLLPFFWSRER